MAAYAPLMRNFSCCCVLSKTKGNVHAAFVLAFFQNILGHSYICKGDEAKEKRSQSDWLVEELDRRVVLLLERRDAGVWFCSIGL